MEEAREMAEAIDPSEVAEEIAVRRRAIIVHADSMGRIRAAHKAEPVTVQGYGACLTRELMDQFSTAQAKDDTRAGDYLLQNGCTILSGGIPLTVIDRTWSFLAQVRVYIDSDAVELWVPAEAIDDGNCSSGGATDGPQKCTTRNLPESCIFAVISRGSVGIAPYSLSDGSDSSAVYQLHETLVHEPPPREDCSSAWRHDSAATPSPRPQLTAATRAVPQAGWRSSQARERSSIPRRPHWSR